MKNRSKYCKILFALLLPPLLIFTQINLVADQLLDPPICLKNGAGINKPENNEIEELKVDCAFSIGGWCICAQYLQNNNLRKTASPLDWVRRCSLDAVANLFETKFKYFFTNISVVNKKNEHGMRTIYDMKNHIESIHYMPYDVPFDQACQEFREKMQKRAKKIDTILSNSESVLLLNCRNNPETIDKDSTDAELKKFAKRFSKIYPNLKKIYLIDIHNDGSMQIHKKIIYQNRKIKIIQYRFKNIDRQNFYPIWLGNQAAWGEIMKHISLTNPNTCYN